MIIFGLSVFKWIFLISELAAAFFGIYSIWGMTQEGFDHEWDSLGVGIGAFVASIFAVPVLIFFGLKMWWVHIPTLICAIRLFMLMRWNK